MARVNQGARYRELGALLREKRERAGLNGRQLAEKVGWTELKVSRVETGQTAIDVVDAIHYLGQLGLYHRSKIADLLNVCREAERKLGYWLSPHGELLQDSLGPLIYHESMATASATYEPQLVPGLLQTTDYARACIAAERWRSPENVEECVRIRMDRQRILDVLHPATFTFFVHEEALRLEVSGPRIMHEQLLKLLLVSALSHVSLRIVPWSAGEHSAFGGPFCLFEFAEYPPLAYMDTYKTGLFLEDKEFIEPFRQLVSDMSEVALDEGQSRELIASLASEYDLRSARDADDHLADEQLQWGWWKQLR